MVAKTLFILFLLHNIIFDSSQCAAPLTSAARGDHPVDPITTPLRDSWVELTKVSCDKNSDEKEERR